MSNDEHGTPLWLYHPINTEYQFELDVCASFANHKNDNYYTKEDDSLSKPWMLSNWCNPPYSDIMPWINKAVLERESIGALTVMLLPADLSTDWFRFLRLAAAEIRFMKGRIAFEGSTQGAKFGSVLAIIKPEPFRTDKGAILTWYDYTSARPKKERRKK